MGIVAIAYATGAILVTICLTCVGYGGAVVTAVAKSIAVCINLHIVDCEGTVVKNIHNGITIRIRCVFNVDDRQAQLPDGKSGGKGPCPANPARQTVVTGVNSSRRIGR